MSETNNISKYNRIQKDILIIAKTFIVKHIIVLNNRAQIRGQTARSTYYYEYGLKKDYPPYDTCYNVNFKAFTQWISLEYKPFYDKNEKEKKCRLYYKDFPGVLNLLNKIKNLFDNNRDIYNLSIDNKILDVSSKYVKLVEIMFFKGNTNRFLSMRPNILIDYDNTIYPAVSIECEEGILCNITYDEFLVLKLALDEYMKNFNLLSNQLLNTAYLHCIGYPNDAEEITEFE